jgi:hypothetical protein
MLLIQMSQKAQKKVLSVSALLCYPDNEEEPRLRWQFVCAGVGRRESLRDWASFPASLKKAPKQREENIQPVGSVNGIFCDKNLRKCVL